MKEKYFILFLFIIAIGQIQQLALVNGQHNQQQHPMCNQDDQPVALTDSCRILFIDHHVQCSSDFSSNRRQGGARIISGNNMQGCGGGSYVIKQEGQQLNSNVNQIILSKQIFPIPPYIPQISNKQHCQEQFQNASFVYDEDCDILQNNTIQVNMDDNIYIQQKDDFSFIELMSDQQFPCYSASSIPASSSSSSQSNNSGNSQNSFSQNSSQDQKKDNNNIPSTQDKSNANSNLLFNRLFNPWNQIITEDMYTLIESYGEIKIYNHSTNSEYYLQIIDIIQDSNIITLEKNKDDIQPNKERIIKYSIIPEEEGKNHEINLYFKIRFYDIRLLKIISSRTVQYTITISNIKANNYGVKPYNLGNIQAGQISFNQLKIKNPNSFDLHIKEVAYIKKYIYMVEDDLEAFTSEGEKNHLLQLKNIYSKDKWHLQPKQESHIISFIVNQNQTGSFIDYLKIQFDNSPLIMQIPFRFKVIADSLSFQLPILHMGIISGRQGYNSRSIVIDNNSNSTIEIQDIVVHYKNNYSCVTVEVSLDETPAKSSLPFEPYQQFSNVGCLNQNKRLIIQPFEENRKIGVLKIFPKTIDANSQQKIFEGRIQLITNSTQNDIEIDYKFYRYEHFMNYTQSITQFKVAATPDETVNSSKNIPSTTVPSAKRKFELTNSFNSQVKVTALKKPPVTDKFNFDNLIQITDFQETSIDIGEKKSIFNFSLIGNLTKFDTYILLEFNRNFVVPIFFKVYNMHLLCAINQVSDYYDCSDLSQYELIKFGNKAINRTAVQEIRLKNDNPEVVTIYSLLKSQSPVNIILKKIINYQGQVQASNRVVIETGKNTPLMYIGPYDEAIFTIVLNTQSIVKSYNHYIQATTNYEQFQFSMEYNVVSGDTIIDPSRINFKRMFNENDQSQTVYIQNTYDVNLKVIDFQISDPRFQILNYTKTIPAQSTKQLLTLVFNRTYGYGSNIKPFNEDNFISIEDMIMWNITQSMIENSESNILSADIVVNFDIKSIFISATAEVQQLRLMNETVIDFGNTETNQFYSKSLTFSNTLDVPVSFQLYIAPQNISSPENYISKQSQFQQEIDQIFCIPLNLYKIPPIKEIYDNLSNLFTNKGSEKSKEVVDPENLLQVQSRPDFDKSQQQNLIQLYEAIKPFLIYYEEQQSQLDKESNDQNGFQKMQNNMNNKEENEKIIYTCKEGKVTQKIVNYMTKIEFTKQLLEYYHNHEQNQQKMQESLLSILSLKKEVVEITQTTRNRPSLFNYNLKVEKGLWDKIKHFLTFGLFTNGQSEENTITDWQSQSYSLGDWQNNINHNRQNQKNDYLSQQQFFLTSEVLNKTIVLQPKQSLDINSLIYMPKYGEANNNLIIKSNASGIDIIPIKGKSGVGRIKIMDVKNMSPILYSQLQNSKNKSLEEIQYKKFIQDNINNDVFIFSQTQEELDGAHKHNVDNMKNYIIKNVGQYPITIKNIYIESQPCAAYGFFILGCSCQFKLEPKQEKTITIGYKSNYPYDTIEKNLYFYTQTYHIKYKIRAQFFHNSSTGASYISSSPSKLTPTLSPLLLNDKKVSDSIIEALNNSGSEGIFSGENFEKEMQNGDSQKIILAFLENVDKSAAASNQQEISLDGSESASNVWTWIKDISQQYAQNNQQITIKDNINPYFNYFILSIIFMTALFFIYTFISFIYYDILSLNSKKSKYDVYQTRNQKMSNISASSLQSPKEGTSNQGSQNINNNNKNSQQNQKQKRNSAQAEIDNDSDQGQYDINAFVRANKIEQNVLNLRSELQKIREFQEKQQMEMRLQKQKQIQLRKNKDANQDAKQKDQNQQDDDLSQNPQDYNYNPYDNDENLDNQVDYNDEYFNNSHHTNLISSEYYNNTNNNNNNVNANQDQKNYSAISQQENIDNKKINEQKAIQRDNQTSQEQNGESSQYLRSKNNDTNISNPSQTNASNSKKPKEKPKKTNKREKDRVVVVATKDNETRSKKNSEENEDPQQQLNKLKKQDINQDDNSEEEDDEDISVVRKNSNKSTSSTNQNAGQTQSDSKKQSSNVSSQSAAMAQRIKDESIQREIEQAILRQQKLKAEIKESKLQQQQNNTTNSKPAQEINNNNPNYKNNKNTSLSNDSTNLLNKKPQAQQQQKQQSQQAQSKGQIEDNQQGNGQSATQKRKKSENFIVDDFHQSNEFNDLGVNQYSLSQQQQIQKKAFLVHDHISSCGEDDDNNINSNNNQNLTNMSLNNNNNSNVQPNPLRKKKISKGGQEGINQFPQIQQIVDSNITKNYSNSSVQYVKKEQDKQISTNLNHTLQDQLKSQDIMKNNSPQKDFDFMDNPLLQQLTASYINNNSYNNSGKKLHDNSLLNNQTETQTTQIQGQQVEISKKKESQKDEQEIEEDFDENQSKSYEQNAPSSDGSQLSSGDSLSEEDIDNFKRSNEQIKAIGFSKLRQFDNGSFIGNDDDSNYSYNNNNNSNNNNSNPSNSLRNSQHLTRDNTISNNQQITQQPQSYNSIPSQGNIAQYGINKDSNTGLNQTQNYQSRFAYTPNQMNRTDSNQSENYCANFLNYQAESSDDDTSQPLTSINQRRYFNVFNSQPCFYPINFMSQNSAVDMSSSNDLYAGENSFTSENASNPQFPIAITQNRTSSNQFSPNQSQQFQPPLPTSQLLSNNANNRNFNQSSGSQPIIDTSNTANYYGTNTFNPTGSMNSAFTNQNVFINSLTRGESDSEFKSDDQPQKYFNSQSLVSPNETIKGDNPSMNRLNQTSYSSRNNGSFNFPHMSSRGQQQYPSSGNIGKKMPNNKSSQNDLEDPQSGIPQQQSKQFMNQQFASVKQSNPTALKFPATGPPPGMGMASNDAQKNSKNQAEYFRVSPELKFEVSQVPPGLLGQSSKSSN